MVKHINTYTLSSMIGMG